MCIPVGPGHPVGTPIGDFTDAVDEAEAGSSARAEDAAQQGDADSEVRLRDPLQEREMRPARVAPIPPRGCGRSTV